jgi:hypothetical protein
VALSSPQTSFALCILAAVDIGRLLLARATDRTAVFTNMVTINFSRVERDWTVVEDERRDFFEVEFRRRSTKNAPTYHTYVLNARDFCFAEEAT